MEYESVKVYILIYDNIFDNTKSRGYFSDDFYVYKTMEIAEKYWEQLGSDRFGYTIKELELLEE